MLPSLSIAAALVLWFCTPPPSVVVTPLPEGWPAMKPSLAERMKGAMPVWLRRWKDSLLRLPEDLILTFHVIDCQGLSNAPLSALSLGKPALADSHGRQVWILGKNELNDLCDRLAQMPGNVPLSRPRIQISDGIPSQCNEIEGPPFNGHGRQGGLAMNLLCRLRPGSTDFRAMIAVSEGVTNQAAAVGEVLSHQGLSFRTNLALTARIQIPNGYGVFLFDAGQGGLNAKRTAFIASPWAITKSGSWILL